VLEVVDETGIGETGIREQGLGLLLVKKPVARVDVNALREGSTGRVVAMVPRIWACVAAAVCAGKL